MKTFAIIATILLLSACATKRYPIATPLSGTEASLMNCRELALELARTEETYAAITNTATTDWRSAAGFLGDFGIGNAMAKSEAEQALSTRRTSIMTAQANNNCINSTE
ncbi:MAG: hypothetical protein ACK46Q_01530 [Hyphomonas sp.]